MSRPKALISNWAWIRLADIEGGRRGFEQLKERLTITPRVTSPYKTEEEIVPLPIYRVDEERGMFGVPREYFLKKMAARYECVDCWSRGTPIILTSRVKLRLHQVEPVQDLYEAFSKQGRLGGILRAPPGSGKTTMALHLASRIGRTTLVIVHQQFLQDQWIERIAQFLPGARVGIVRQNKLEYKGKDIVIAMVGTLLARRLPDDFYRWAGFCITDEIHRHGSQTWSNVLPLFNPRWRLGLSGTVDRQDRAENVFFWHVGPILASAVGGDLPFKVRKLKTGFKMSRSERFNPEHLGDQRLRLVLAGSNARNGLIVAEIIKAVDAGRKPIVFSHLRKHLWVLSEGLRALRPRIWYDFYTGSWYTKNPQPGKKLPKLRTRKKAELAEAAKAQVVFATIKMAAEALDIQELDTLFFGTPLSDVRQPVGRIRRPCPNKKSPVVVDVLDDCTTRLRQMAKARFAHYRRMGAFDQEQNGLCENDKSEEVITSSLILARGPREASSRNPLVSKATTMWSSRAKPEKEPKTTRTQTSVRFKWASKKKKSST